MIALSVNVNKVATLRNARGGNVPSVIEAVDACVRAGAQGITVHHRADERHIRRRDVLEIASHLAGMPADRRPEFNIEGDPRPDLLDLVAEVRPSQCTLVPVTPGEITSQAGWAVTSDRAVVGEAIERVHAAGVRVSVFIDPTAEAVAWAKSLAADRVELYTEPFARGVERGEPAASESVALYRRAAQWAHDAGLGVNAGHDLDLRNLPLFRTVPHVAEVSIGHALISHALFAGLERAVREYRAALGHPL